MQESRDLAGLPVTLSDVLLTTLCALSARSTEVSLKDMAQLESVAALQRLLNVKLPEDLGAGLLHPVCEALL